MFTTKLNFKEFHPTIEIKYEHLEIKTTTILIIKVLISMQIVR